MSRGIRFKLSSNIQDYVKYLNNVPEKTQLDLENEFPKLRQNTKKTVQHHLKKGSAGADGRLTEPGGFRTGTYKKSMTINNFAESRWMLGFQVFARKPHYRLSHLLEDGHVSYCFRWGRGRPTYLGNIGMVRIKHGKKTIKIPHIEPGQEYAEKQIVVLYKNTMSKHLSERMIRKK